MKIKFISLACLGAIFVAGTAMGQTTDRMPQKENQNAPMHHSYMMRSAKPEGFYRMDCKLTDAQKASFNEIRLKCFKETKPLKDQLRELQAHQQTLVTADNPDLRAINANIDQMSGVKAKLQKIRVKAQIDKWSQLTDEQKMQLSEHFRGKMAMHRGGERYHQLVKKGSE